jgi:hypothetical protein
MGKKEEACTHHHLGQYSSMDDRQKQEEEGEHEVHLEPTIPTIKQE